MMSKFNPPEANRQISLIDAFDTMRFFLEKYWGMGGKKSDDFAAILSSLDRGEGMDNAPLDIALWSDWVKAVNEVVSFRG